MVRHKPIPKTILRAMQGMLKEYIDLTEEELEALLSESKPELEKVWYNYDDISKILLCTKRHVINLINANPDIEVYFAGKRSPRLNKEGISALITLRPRHPDHPNNKLKEA